MRICVTTCIRSCGCGCGGYIQQQQCQQCQQSGSSESQQVGYSESQQVDYSESQQVGYSSYMSRGDEECARGGCQHCHGQQQQQQHRSSSRHARGGSRGDDSDDEWSTHNDDRDGGSRTYAMRSIDEVDRPKSIDKARVRASAHNLEYYEPHWAPEYRGGRVRALLIGINYYGSKSELSGCVNDVRHELTALKKIKFPADEVAILVDDDSFPNVIARPTRENMLKYMAWLVDDAQEGDVLFMHYSGHGTQTRSNDKQEKKDQVICPVDYESAGVITDNDLYELLARELPAGVRLTVVLDCCNSGSALDLPYMFAANSGSSRSGYHMKQVRSDNHSRGDVLMFSGAADTQTSTSVKNTSKVAKTGSQGKSTGGPGGAATQCFTYILEHMDELSYKDAVLRARELLSRQDLDQTPQLSASRPIDLNARFSLTEPLRTDRSVQRSHDDDDDDN